MLLASLWWTWRAGRIELHEQLGYLTLGVLLFRVYWGLFGSATARFSQFVKGPRAIAAYLRGGLPPQAGHNPLGALSVLLLFGLMIAEVGLGLFRTGHRRNRSRPPRPLRFLRRRQRRA